MTENTAIGEFETAEKRMSEKEESYHKSTRQRTQDILAGVQE